MDSHFIQCNIIIFLIYFVLKLLQVWSVGTSPTWILCPSDHFLSFFEHLLLVQSRVRACQCLCVRVCDCLCVMYICIYQPTYRRPQVHFGTSSFNAVSPNLRTVRNLTPIILNVLTNLITLPCITNPLLRPLTRPPHGRPLRPLGL